MTYSFMNRATLGLSLALAAVLMLVPQLIFWLFGLEPHVSAEVISRRAALLFGILALMLWALRALEPQSITAKSVAKAIAAGMLALALLGLTELALGRVGFGILLAITAELGFAYGWMKVFKS